MMPKINFLSRQAGHFSADALELRYTAFLAQKRSMIGLFFMRTSDSFSHGRMQEA